MNRFWVQEDICGVLNVWAADEPLPANVAWKDEELDGWNLYEVQDISANDLRAIADAIEDWELSEGAMQVVAEGEV